MTIQQSTTRFHADGINIVGGSCEGDSRRRIKYGLITLIIKTKSCVRDWRNRQSSTQGRVSGVGVKREILTKLLVQQRVVVADRINIRRRRHTTIVSDLLLHLVTMTPILLRPVMFQPAAAVRVVVRGEKRNRERSGKKQWLPFKPQKVNCKLS